MSENKLYGVLLAALLALAYLSWHRASDAPGETQVALLNGQPQALKGIRLVAPTATVAVSFREAEPTRHAWFEVQTASGQRRFTGNKAFHDNLKAYAQLKAERSLGKLGRSDLEQTGLVRPSRRLELEFGERVRSFEIGGQTSGARDYYLRRAGGKEVFLVRRSMISDLETPQGRFMQRRLRRAPLKDVAELEISAGSQTTAGLQQNRVSPTDAYWARAENPDSVSDALGNYVTKLERLTAVKYLEDASVFDGATPVLSVRWKGDDEELLDTLELRRRADTSTPTYIARTNATQAPVEVPRFVAEQLESDLALVLSP